MTVGWSGHDDRDIQGDESFPEQKRNFRKKAGGIVRCAGVGGGSRFRSEEEGIDADVSGEFGGAPGGFPQCHDMYNFNVLEILCGPDKAPHQSVRAGCS